MNLAAALIKSLEDPNYQEEPLVHFFWIFTYGIKMKGILRCKYLYNKYYLSLGCQHLPREHPENEAGKWHATPYVSLASLFILNGICDNRVDYQSSGLWVTWWCEPEEKRWRKDSVVERLRALFISYINSGKVFNLLESQFFPFTCKMK